MSNGWWGTFQYLPFPVAYVNQPKYLAISDPRSSRLIFVQEEWLNHRGDAENYDVECIDRQHIFVWHEYSTEHTVLFI